VARLGNLKKIPHMLFTESECKKIRAKKIARSASSNRSNDRPRILVVEDDSVLRRLNAEVLICSGYQVDAADSGATAWDALQVNDYDLMITDNNMPQVSGVELIGKMHAAGLAIPVIMATGTFPTAEFTKSPWLRPVCLLLKPYSMDALLSAVKDVVSAPSSASPEILAVSK